MKIEAHHKDKLLKAYKAFHAKVQASTKESDLSVEEMKAIGMKVMNDLIEEVSQKLNFTESEKEKALEEIKALISKEFPDNLWNTNVEPGRKRLK